MISSAPWKSVSLYAANAADVRTTVVAGQVLMEERRVLTLDADKTRALVEDAVHELISRAGVAPYLKNRKL